MMRAGRKTAYLALLLALITLLSGCIAYEEREKPSFNSPHSGLEIPSAPEEPDVIRLSLTVVAKKAEMSECKVTYPYVCNANMDLLNLSIHTVFAEFAADCETPGAEVNYTLEFNRYGLLSFMLTCTSNGKVINEDAANFDSDTGKRVRLSDCFGSTETDYTVRLRDILARSIEQNGYTILGQEPSMDDSTLFLFTYGGIYLVFREYELFSSDAGSPRIKVKISAVMDHLAPDGLLNRVK
jgi:hypothetical protein